MHSYLYHSATVETNISIDKNECLSLRTNWKSWSTRVKLFIHSDFFHFSNRQIMIFSFVWQLPIDTASSKLPCCIWNIIGNTVGHGIFRHNFMTMWAGDVLYEMKTTHFPKPLFLSNNLSRLERGTLQLLVRYLYVTGMGFLHLISHFYLMQWSVRSQKILQRPK